MNPYKDKIVINPEPFLIDLSNTIVSVAEDNSDLDLIRFVNALDDALGFEDLRFLHISQDFLSQNQAEITKKIIRNKISFVYQTNSLDKRISVLIEEGNKGTIIAKYVNGSSTDLVILKKKKYRDKALSKLIKTIRLSNTNCIVYPEKAKYNMSQLVVPIDLSINSARALKAAIRIQELTRERLTITCLCVIEVPSSEKCNEEDVQKQIENMDSAMDDFILRTAKYKSNFFRKKLVLKDSRSIAEIIDSQVQKLNGDFIILGSQGHSDVHFKLIGSTTEALIARNDHTPILIVK